MDFLENKASGASMGLSSRHGVYGGRLLLGLARTRGGYSLSTVRSTCYIFKIWTSIVFVYGRPHKR